MSNCKTRKFNISIFLKFYLKSNFSKLLLYIFQKMEKNWQHKLIYYSKKGYTYRRGPLKLILLTFMKEVF